MSCCPPGSWGAVNPPADYVNKGKREQIGTKLSAYVVRPSSGAKSSKCIVACMDIFGEDSGRTKVICDDFAERFNCLVIMPNWLENDAWQVSWGMPNSPIYNLLWFIPFLVRHSPSKTAALFKSDVEPFFKKEGIDSFAMFSFCWGALNGEAFSAMPGAKAHVGFHPSHATYPISFTSLEKALGAVKCPQMYLVAANDQVKPGDKSELAIRNGAKQEVSITLYDKQQHGWVNRGDVTKPEVAADVERALNQACEFIGKYL